MSEGAEQTPDVSPPRLPPERPPTVFVRGETLEPSTARPKVRISRKSRRAFSNGETEKIDEPASTSSREKDVESNAFDPLGHAVVKASHMERLSSKCD